MNKYDVVIIGGSTTGSWFARKMSERGFSVLVIDKDNQEDVGSCYDIFHMDRKSMHRFGLPSPVQDEDKCFEFTDGTAFSPYGNYPKNAPADVVGMHKQKYIVRMNKWAQESGAKYIYGASFSEFIYENHQIRGLVYKKNGKHYSVAASIVSDCSGISAVGRTSLPDSSEVENFVLSPSDMFYVILFYCLYPEDYTDTRRSDSWMFYKAWQAPQQDPKGVILGVGANRGFDYAQQVFDLFKKNIKLPEYTVTKVEKGVTPYRRPPYSFVTDGFICMGDAACLTGPTNGEGCITSLVQAEIAVEVISRELKIGGYITAQRLWSINKRYVEAQGKEFALLRTVLIGAVAAKIDEFEYLFKNDIIFSDKLFEGLAEGLQISSADISHTVIEILKGIFNRGLSVTTVKMIVNAVLTAGRMEKLYSEYPDTPQGFAEWCKRAEELWEKAGNMSDNCSYIFE